MDDEMKGRGNFSELSDEEHLGEALFEEDELEETSSEEPEEEDYI